MCGNADMATSGTDSREGAVEAASRIAKGARPISSELHASVADEGANRETTRQKVTT